MSKLASLAWWREVLDRAVRQGVQVLTPLLVLASAGQVDGLTVETSAAAAGLATIAVVLKAVSGFNTGSVYERGAGALAGALLAILPLDLTGVLHLDVRATLTSIAGTTLLALIGYRTNPPVSSAPSVPDATTSPSDGTTSPAPASDLTGE